MPNIRCLIYTALLIMPNLAAGNLLLAHIGNFEASHASCCIIGSQQKTQKQYYLSI